MQLAHELTHAAQHLVYAAPETVADCLECEMQAFLIQAQVWQSVGPRGSEGYWDINNLLVHRHFKQKTIRRLVLDHAGYQEQFLGRALPNY